MQVEGYANGTFDLIKDLPVEVSGLPKNVSPLVHPTLARLCLWPPKSVLVDGPIQLPCSGPAKPCCSPVQV